MSHFTDDPQRPRCHFCARRRKWRWVSVSSRMTVPGGYALTVPADMRGICVRSCRQCAKTKGSDKSEMQWERNGRTMRVSFTF